MQRFKNILVVYNYRIDDDSNFEQAAALAKRNNARLKVVEVIEALPRHRQPTIAPSENDKREFVEERQVHLSHLIAPLREQGIPVSTTATAGKLFREVTREVLREKHDLVIIAAEERAGLKRLLFGSTLMHLLRECPSPVWVTKPAQRRNYAHILAALDPDPTDAVRDGLNVAIMDLATSLARLEGSKLHIVHAWELTGSDLDKSRSEATQDDIDKLLGKNEETHKLQLDRVLNPYRLEGLSHRVHLARGKPESVINNVARMEDVDLIVMGTVCRTGVPGFLIGNTAEKVLQRAECAVLTLKPEGFVTPVRLDA